MAGGANKLTDNLWMGSAPPGGPLDDDFDCLVLCAEEYQPENNYFGQLEVVRIPLYDDGIHKLTQDEMRQSIKIAIQLIGMISVGKKILVTCWQGRNRSGLITAIVLMLGMNKTAQEVTQIIRSARGEYALQNDDFLEFINLIEQAHRLRQGKLNALTNTS